MTRLGHGRPMSELGGRVRPLTLRLISSRPHPRSSVAAGTRKRRPGGTSSPTALVRVGRLAADYRADSLFRLRTSRFRRLRSLSTAKSAPR